MNILYVIGGFSVIEPMGVMHLSAVAKAVGHRCWIASCREKEITEKIKELSIDAVAMSVMSTEAPMFGAVSRALRSQFPSLIQVAGGPHPTYYPEIVDTWPLDAVVVGEGEEGIVPLLERLAAGQSVADLSGIHTRTSKNPPCCLIENLDTLPFVDRELVSEISPIREVSMKTFFATRGCPFDCSYCFNHAYNRLYQGKGKTLRRRSVANLLKELEEVKARYQPSFIRFGDDAFILKHDSWVDDFCEQYRQRIGIPFYFLIHPNVVTEPLVKKLKAAGAYSVMMGIESGNEAVRQKMLNRFISNATMRTAFALFRENGIKVFANTILAIPDTTLKEDLESLEFTLDCRPFYSGFSIFTPFPGTPLGDYARTRGYVPDLAAGENALPLSMQMGSVLNTVTDRERQIHRNILILAPVANLLPVLRSLVTRQLIYWPPNFLFDFLGFCVRNYCNMRIWPFRKNIFSFVKIFWNVMMIDRSNYGRQKTAVKQ